MRRDDLHNCLRKDELVTVRTGGRIGVPQDLKRALLFIVVLLLTFGSLADKELLLKDGSRIRGEVLSMNNGVYEIRTQSMGTIKLGSQQIESIMPITNTSAVVSSPPTDVAGMAPSALQSLQSSMTSNTAIMSSIMELQNDPQMQAVLADPEVMRAVQNFDLEALANNPKIRALMNNAKVRSIQGAAQ